MNITGDNMDTRMSIKEIALKLQEITNPNDDFFIQCQHDERKGIINLV